MWQHKFLLTNESMVWVVKILMNDVANSPPKFPPSEFCAM